MSFIEYQNNDQTSIKNALPIFQDLYDYYNAFKKNGSCAQLIFASKFPELLTLEVGSNDFFLKLDQLLKLNPNAMPDNLAYLYLLGNNETLIGTFIGPSPTAYFNRIDTLKTNFNGIITYSKNITKFIPIPSITNVPTLDMVLKMIENDLKNYMTSFNDYVLSVKRTVAKETYELFKNEKEKIIFNTFLSGDISLDYLKSVSIPDRILKVERDLETPSFPLFLKKMTNFSDYVFDANYLLTDIESIRPFLLRVTNYIEYSLFAQDIHTLNKLADQVARSIGINNQIIKLFSVEESKLNNAEKELGETLAGFKQLQTVYDMLKSQQVNAIDPVVQSQLELDAEINKEVERLKSEHTASIMKTQEALRKEEESKRLIVSSNIVENKESVKDFSTLVQKTETEIKPDDTKAKTTKLPLFLGLGIIGAFLLGGNNE